jgi:two-component system LytT family sensor kinase
MRQPFISRYWAFQLIGWGFFVFINLFFNILFDKYSGELLIYLSFIFASGILSSHLIRFSIHQKGVMMKSINTQLVQLLIFTILYSCFFALLKTPFERRQEYYPVKGHPSYQGHFLYNFVTCFGLLLVWSGIYFMYHYVAKSRKQQMDTIKLESLVKELELKTIKAHINPHFIFNALNSIRALIDENPERARTAVTELSNILRSSLKAEKGETVCFSDELKIVKDYLALENMRFEDRLRVEYDIDKATLSQNVPPMMLQTLVENAIKHGISKQMRGGVVKIISDFTDQYHEMSVQNTGRLGDANPSTGGGFGLSSTQDRLSLLYGEKARFEIKQLSMDMVEAKVLIPA